MSIPLQQHYSSYWWWGWNQWCETEWLHPHRNQRTLGPGTAQQATLWSSGGNDVVLFSGLLSTFVLLNDFKNGLSHCLQDKKDQSRWNRSDLRAADKRHPNWPQVCRQHLTHLKRQVWVRVVWMISDFTSSLTVRTLRFDCGKAAGPSAELWFNLLLNLQSAV